MTGVEAAHRLPAITARAWAAAGVAALVVVGYAGVVDLRVSAALAAAAALAGWAALSYQRPRAVLSASFLLVLIAGTKFRHRDASDSLAGVMDAQILFELGVFAAVGVAVLAWWIAAGDRRRLTRVEMLIGGYAGIALLSTLWSVAPAMTMVRAAQLLIVAALAMASVRLLTPRDALWTACGSVAVYAVVCTVVGPTFPWTSEFADAGERLRFAWFQMHPIAAGTLAAIAALGLLSAAFWPSPYSRSRILGVPLACYSIPLVVILVATNSRGPLLAFAVAAGTLAFMRVRWPVRLVLTLVTAAAVLLLVVAGPDVIAWLVSADRDTTVSRLFFQGQSADGLLGLNGRLDLWTDLSSALAAQSLAGYGYQASRVVLLEVASWAGYAHNALLQSLLDLGAAGTVMLIAVVAVAGSSAVRPALPPWLRGTLTAVVVFLLLNAVATESFAGAPGFETLLLFVCALSAASGHVPASPLAATA
jgi:exopolysaccharide production protein ExoQ